MGAAPVHHTSVDKDGSWDGPAAKKAFEGTTVAEFNDLFAWVDPDDKSADGDLNKSAGWGPHHDVSDGKPGAANLKGVQTAMAALNGGRGGSSKIPEGDRKAVWNHLAAHYRDAGIKDEDIPELKAAGDNVDACNRCDGEGTISLQGEEVPCPQCGGSGTSDNNAEAKSRAKIEARAARADELRRTLEKRVAARHEFELREVPNGTGGTTLRFTGFACVTDAEYEMEDWLGPWIESVSVGAFGKTLSESCDTAFLINHEGMTLARTKPGTLKLSEETAGTHSPVYGITGLYSQADLDPQNLFVQAMRSAVERGDLDEMSFAFWVMRQEWNGDYTRRWINEVSIDKGDVSLVNFGANPSTGGTVGLRQRRGPGQQSDGDPRAGAALRSLRLWDRLGTQFREGKVLSAENQGQLESALDALHSADDVDIPGIVRALQDIDGAVDEGLAAVSFVLGQANPDGDPGDLEPELGPPEAEALLDYGREDRLRLERYRHRSLA